MSTLRDDLKWMQMAYEQALKAFSMEEVPVGAVLVSAEQELLAVGHNQVRRLNDPTAHAEIVALRGAAATVGNYRLVNTTLYVTLEPCCMCLGALMHARVRRLVFATPDLRAGAASSVLNLTKHPVFNHKMQVDSQVMQTECKDLLQKFFKARRK